jgi:SAM-dependent methyltransferase
MKPVSEASERNKEPILAILRSVFVKSRHVLEIGSGTGQHAVHFAAALPHLTWQTSDLPANHEGITSWLTEAALPNTPPVLALDLSKPEWPIQSTGAIFCANTIHIVSWPLVEALFRGIGRVLEPGGLLVVYGPFNYNGQFTSESNARFDVWLKNRDPVSGIRDFEKVDALARAQGLQLESDHEMPANNRMLVWRRDI